MDTHAALIKMLEESNRANQMMREEMAEMRQKQDEIHKSMFCQKSKVTTLAELLERYETAVSSQKSKSGYVVEKYRLGALKKTPMASLLVSDITSNTIAQWRNNRLNECATNSERLVSPSTVKRDMVLLCHVFSKAIREWGFNIKNPVSLVEKPKESAPKDRVLDDNERELLLNECKNQRNPWVYPVVKFALESAARRGEILSLEWKDVNLDKATVRLNGKTGPRTVGVTPECVELLKSLPRDTDKVFPITVEALKQAFGRVVKKIGIGDFTLHGCRHDALTRFARLGLSILELQEISGHTSTDMLRRYVTKNPEGTAIKLAQKLSNKVPSCAH
jgi:integrase